MRILLLNADYPRFLAWFYQRHPGLEKESYAVQMTARNASLFGVADFYSRNFTALGHQAAEIHVNNQWLQSAWAREHGMAVGAQEPPGTRARESRMPPGWLQRMVTPFKPMLRPLARKIGLSPGLDAAAEEILLAQIEEFRPDVVINQDTFYIDTELARRIKTVGNPLLIGQVGIEPSRGQDWSVYDLMISQLPSTIHWFRSRGIRAELNHLAFEPSILATLPEPIAKDIDISFVGSVSADHQQRVALLEAVARRYDLKLWGNRPETLPASSPLHRCFQGEAWGHDMYQLLRRSRITLNSHIDLARTEAGNMRLFEATGVGAFLLTDFKDNLDMLFAPGSEVAVWHSIDDCITAIDRMIDDESGRAAIARAGQARTLAQHTYRQRAVEILGFVEGLPKGR
jgi:spore maturation protein CgeB